MAEQNKLDALLSKEIALLDNILDYQTRVYVSVKEKNWLNLESNMDNLTALSTQFSEMENERDAIVSELKRIPEDSMSLLAMLRSRLLRSKVQSQAMSTYIEATQNFVRGVLDNAVPQRRNVLYSRNGKIVKEEPSSVVLNKVL